MKRKSLLKRIILGNLVILMSLANLSTSVLAENESVPQETSTPETVVEEEPVSSTDSEDETVVEETDEVSSETETTASPAPTTEPAQTSDNNVEPPVVNEDGMSVYVAENVVDMVSAVATLSDDSEKRLIVSSDEALPEMNINGTAIYYDGTYIIETDDTEKAKEIIESELGSAVVETDDVMDICEVDSESNPATVEENISEETKQSAEDGLTVTENTDKPVVAVIDTGVNDLATVSVNLTSDPDTDAVGHGTEVAKTIIDSANGNVEILSIKAFNDNGKASLSNVTTAVKYAIEAKVDIINISASMLDSDNTTAFKEAVTSALNAGIIVVASAGNKSDDVTKYVPANIDGVIAVASATSEGIFTEFTNYGENLVATISDSTSIASAKISGYIAKDGYDNLFTHGDVFVLNKSAENLPEGEDTYKAENVYVTEEMLEVAGCLDVGGSCEMSNNDGYYSAFGLNHYTMWNGADGSGMCADHGLTTAGYRGTFVYAGDVSSADGLVAWYGFEMHDSGNAYEAVRAQAYLWGMSSADGNYSSAYEAAYAYAQNTLGIGNRIVSPTLSGSYGDKYIPDLTYTITDTSGSIASNNYYISDVSVTGGDKSAVSYSLNGNTIIYKVDGSKDIPETITFTLASNKPDVQGSITGTGVRLRDPNGTYQSFIVGGKPIGTQGITYGKASFTVKASYPTIQIKKSSKESQFSALTKTYNFAGTTFEVYRSQESAENRDKSGNNYVTSIVLDADGNGTYKCTETRGIRDTLYYYLIETKAGNGYLLDSTVYKLEIYGDGILSFKPVNQPVNDPIQLELTKKNKDNWEVITDLTRKDADFTLYYYDGYYEDVTGLTPTKSWVYTTKENANLENPLNGYINFTDESYKTGGDELYKRRGTIITFPIGTYAIKETKAPYGYELDDNYYIFQEVLKDGATIEEYNENHASVIEHKWINFEALNETISVSNKMEEVFSIEYEYPDSGYMYLKKTVSSNNSLVELAPELYTLAGTKYDIYYKQDPNGVTVYDDNTEENLAVTVTLDANGEMAEAYFYHDIKGQFDEATHTLTLPIGKYDIKESTSTKGYYLDTNTYSFEVKNEETTTVNMADEPMFTDFDLLVKKTVTRLENNPHTDDDLFDYTYNLDGAKFKVEYFNQILTDEKMDSATPTKTWTFVAHHDKSEPNENGKVYYTYDFLGDDSARDLFVDDDGQFVALQGSYRITELVPPKGLTLNKTPVTRRVEFIENVVKGSSLDPRNTNAWGDDSQYSSKEDAEITDIPQYVQIEYQKEEKENGSTTAYGEAYGGSFANAEYELYMFKSYASEESKWQYVEKQKTDETGKVIFTNLHAGTYKIVEVKPSAGHLIDTDLHQVMAIIDATDYKAEYTYYYGESAEQHIQVNITKEGLTLTSGDTVALSGATLAIYRADDLENPLETWVTDGSAHELKGIPVGEYVIKEISAPEGYLTNLYGIKFKIEYNSDYTGYTITYTNDDFLIEDNNMVDEFIPLLSTKAWFIEGIKNHAAEVVTITDEVSYEGVIVNHPYLMVGEIVDKETGTVLATAQKEFTPTNYKGTVNVTFADFDASTLEGKEIVVYETLYRTDRYHEATESTDDNNKVAEHKELTDEDQTLRFPKIGTTAVSEDDSTKLINANGTIKIVDTVKYEVLKTDIEYTIKGTLYDKETGEKLLVNGSEVTAETKFTPTTSNGTVDITFEFDASGLEGKSLVAFEKLFENDIQIAHHEDIDDEGQTVYAPKLRTTAIDKSSNTHVLTMDESSVIVDTVKYENVIPNLTYVVKASLVYKNGEEVTDYTTTAVEFVPTETSGSVDVELTVKSKLLIESEVVVFEELYLKNTDTNEEVKKGEHTDVDDTEQTIYVPNIKTKATAEDGTKEVFPSEEVTIIDTVTYKNLNVGTEYTMKGVLMNKKTGEKLLTAEGEEITAETKFTPTTSNGTVKIKFTFNAKSMSLLKVVVFERLYINDIEVTTHTDINDEDQTVEILGIATVATNSDGSKTINVKYDDEATVYDTVKYAGVEVGKEYTLKGELHLISSDGKSSEKVLATNEVKFTATDTIGEQKVSFVLKGLKSMNLNGRKAVVYETLYNPDGNVYAEEKDLTNADQTVNFKFENRYRTVAITKYDATTYKELPGAKMKVVDSSGKTIDEWTSTLEQHLVENLIVGDEYTLIEVIAPKSYALAQSVKFVVEDNNKVQQTVAMYDSLLPSGVKTGTTNWTVVCGGIAILSLVGLILLQVNKRKKA